MKIKRGRQDHSPSPPSKRSRREASVYDAVAGRVGYESFIKGGENGPLIPVRRPDEVLYRQRRAPQRYAEHDEYYILGRLVQGQTLPDSDLLEALHAYVSDHYSAVTHSKGSHDWKSLDGTALIALGILVEETLASALGETGDLAFLEASDAGDGLDSRGFWDGHNWVQSAREKRGQTTTVYKETDAADPTDDG